MKLNAPLALLCAVCTLAAAAPAAAQATATTADAATAPATQATMSEADGNDESVAAAKTLKDDSVTITWKDGFKLATADGRANLKIGGRLMVDYAQISDSELVASGGPPSQSGIEFRRARLEIGGGYGEHIGFKFQYDFASSDPFKDNYLELADLAGDLSLRFGKMYEPFMLDDLTSSKYTTFMERSLPLAFSPGRQLGFDIGGTVADQRITLRAGAFKPEPHLEGVWATGARLTAQAYRGDRGVVHVGGAFSYRNVDEIDFDSRPEAHLAAKLADTGVVAVDDEIRAAAELAAAFGPAHVQGEFVASMARDAGGAGDALLAGWYGQAGVFLTGEQRPYKASAGTFSRVKPKREAFVDGGWGAWELALRVSALDLSDGAVIGGELTDYTAGLNWYLARNVRMMLNYVAAKPRGLDPMHITQTRVQVDF